MVQARAIVLRPARAFGCTNTRPLAGLPLQRLADREASGVEVDSGPRQSERLVLAQTKGEGYDQRAALR